MPKRSFNPLESVSYEQAAHLYERQLRKLSSTRKSVRVTNPLNNKL